MNKNKRVLAIGAHPDDVEFMCSGTLKLLKDSGYKIYIGIVSKGDLGSAEYSIVETTKVRRKEALNAAELLDAELTILGESDLRIFMDDKTRMKITEYIRKVEPLIVFTHPPHDYMVDHEVTSNLVRFGCFAAPIPNYLTYDPDPARPIGSIPYLYYFAPIEGKDIYGRFVPQDIYVNISDVIDFKVKMLSLHESQRNWLLKQHGMDKYTESMKNTCKILGERCGFNYAEGFIQHKGNAYPDKNILKDILRDYVFEKYT